MPSLWHALLCAAAATLFWTGIGFPLARRVAPERGIALAFAPALGWAVFNATAFPILLLAGFDRWILFILIAATAALAIAAMLIDEQGADSLPSIPWLAWPLAALVALAPAAAIVPKFVGGGVRLALPIYDHSKIALIEDIAGFGLPAGNPFFGGSGTPDHLGYYYLWHFSAAIWTRLLGIGGWEADLSLTWFTAFASLLAMMGLAVRVGGRAGAALWVAPLSLTLTLGPVLAYLVGQGTLYRLISVTAGLQGWLAQASWVPQHLASATSVALAVVILWRMAESGRWLLSPILALVAAAGFESSTWIGGVTFAVAALPLGAVLARVGGMRFLAQAVSAALLAAALAAPFLHDEYVATAARHVGLPIAFSPFQVLGPFLSPELGRILDLPAFWLVFLVIEFPAIYLPGGVALLRGIAGRDPGRRLKALSFAILPLTGFGIAWLLTSTIQNNDLGWRAILPGLLVLTSFTAAGLSRWTGTGRRFAAATAILLLLLGLPGGVAQIRSNLEGYPADTDAGFARSPELWAAVDRHAAQDERVGNDPLWLGETVEWPVNITWALFAHRRSCFAGWDLARAYVALPGDEIDRLEQLFERVFAGDGSPEEIHDLATRYACRVIVIAPDDGAWQHDDFAASPDYRLVEEVPDRWRIYRATEK